MTRRCSRRTASRLALALISPFVAFCGPGGGAGDGGVPDGRGADTGAADPRCAMPTRRPGALDNVAAISARSIHTCALGNDGTVSCWGGNAWAQRGCEPPEGSVTSGLRYAAPVVGLSDVVEISAGGLLFWSESDHARLRDGTVMSWGSNFGGERGNGAVWDRNAEVLSVVWAPEPVPGVRDAVQVVSGAAHACALLRDGTARCWGTFFAAPLLQDTTPSVLTSPTEVDGLRDAVQLAAGSAHTCARMRDGSVQCWGANDVGALGNDRPEVQMTPVAVAGLAGVAEIVAGAWHTCARMLDGTIQCWGFGRGGQLGDGAGVDRPSPAPVPGLTGVLSVAAGALHNCALMADHTVQCWGTSAAGEVGHAADERCPVSAMLGSSESPCSLRPSAVPNLSGVRQLALGDLHSCALLESGEVRCWGDNFYGQLGTVSTSRSINPVSVQR